MMTASQTSGQRGPEAALPLILEILQGNGASRQFPVIIRSLSARGVILAAGQVPGDLNLESCPKSDSIIHLPTGEIREIRGNLTWARSRGENGSEVVFGLELSSSNLKVRRALEEQLLAYPEDLKNMWDHWDAVFEGYETSDSVQPVSQIGSRASRLEHKAILRETKASQPQQAYPASDHAYYWVGFGGVLVGLSVYFLAPESYRLFGVILAAYGSLTVAGKGVSSLVQKRPRSQG